jgi:hypothetical protein
MSLIKNCIKALSVVVLLSSSNVFASDILVDGFVMDPDTGTGSKSTNGYAYDIDKMDVIWDGTNDMITVDVFTNFAKENNTEYDYGSRFGEYRKRIIYGDLLIGAQDGTNDPTNASSFNYAFSLGDFISDSWLKYQDYFQGDKAGSAYYNADRYYAGDQTKQKSGGLYAIDGTTTAGEFHGTDKGGSVFGNLDGGEINGGSSSWSVSNDMGKISFSFSVAGIDAFKNATALSLSWAMSCYNDAVHGSWEVAKNGGGGGGSTPVPEPQTLLLMLLGVIGIAARRKQQGFNA